MLHALKPNIGSKKPKKRLGRGNGSGLGTFCGKGVKGQKARAGRGKGAQFEGGQTPLIRRQPKLGGFRNPNREEYEVLNLDSLEERLESGSYDIEGLKEARLVDGKLPVKLLGRGKLTKKFTLSVHAVSKSAKEAVSSAGGSVKIV
jgi:large subunit ribosomal protein L15